MLTSERRENLLRLLCQRRHDTVADLARELNVSCRTVRRDVEWLSEREPIYTRQGRGVGGVYVVDGYYSERLYMKAKEITALKLIATYLKLNPDGVNKEDIDCLEMIIKKYSKPSLIKRRKQQ